MTEEPPFRIDERLQAVAKAVDAYLARTLDEAEGLPAPLAEAMSYALLGGGKRLRPSLAMLACEAVGGRAGAVLPAAAAVEMVHAFSLVHDDLPALDDDDLRRGQPTCHVKFGEAMAILAGDALATLPYCVIAREVKDAVLAARLARELAEATMRMIAGQVQDTMPEAVGDERGSPVERLERIHRDKTGALIRAACRMGAMCGGAGEKELAAITAYGEAVGLLFQIVDDVLDATQTTEHLGKRAGKDDAAGKRTYPSVLGLDESRRRIETLRRAALDALDPLGPNRANPLAQFCERLAVRTR